MTEQANSADIIARLERLEGEAENLRYLLDYNEICDLTSYYTQIYFMLKNEECADLFAQNTPGTSIEIFDRGVYEGIDRIREFYRTMTQNTQRPGWLQQHLALNPVIKISKDRTRAKGLFHSPGIVSRFLQEKLTAYWNWAKYDISFVKEAGTWKFHKLRAVLVFQTPYEQGWVERPVASSSGGYAGIKPDRLSTYHMPYNPFRINVFEPAPPEQSDVE